MGHAPTDCEEQEAAFAGMWITADGQLRGRTWKASVAAPHPTAPQERSLDRRPLRRTLKGCVMGMLKCDLHDRCPLVGSPRREGLGFVSGTHHREFDRAPLSIYTAQIFIVINIIAFVFALFWWWW